MIPASVVETYSAGQCMWLALALHQRFGFQIVVMMEDECLSHAFVRLTSGRGFDIAGIDGQRDFIWPGVSQRDVTPAELHAIVGLDEGMLAEAHATIDRWVLPAYNGELI